jgi:large subunit ribosomal protein L25
MEIARLEAEPREGRGTRAARRLRRQGKLPGVVYGHGETPENVAVVVHDLETLLEHGSHVLELKVNGTTKRVLIKAVQFDHLGLKPIHVDFMRVDLTERVHVSVPLDFRGTPIGTHEGGLLEHELVDVEIDCVVTEIPEAIRVNVTDMGVGDVLHVRDLPLPSGVKAITAAETIVCSVRAKKVSVEVEAAEAVEEEAEEPEIIGRKEKEEESEEGGS